MKQLTKDVIEWIRDYFKYNDDGKAIVGISGGKDSAVCAALLVEALGSERVLGVLMPNGYQEDIESAYAVCSFLNIPKRMFNIHGAYSVMVDTVTRYLHKTPSEIENNLPDRLRMCYLYTIGSLYPNSRIANTTNKSERYIGYATKWGNIVGDFAPLANLTTREVIEIGDDLGLPYDIVHKVSHGNIKGKSKDEDLGFTSDDLDTYLLEGPESVPEDVAKKIEFHNTINKHKTELMPKFEKNS